MGRQRPDASVGDFVDGNRHPELFTPVELLDNLVDHLFLMPSNQGQEFRAGLLEKLKKAGIAPNISETLQRETRAWVELSMAVTKAADAHDDRGARRLGLSACRERAESLQRIRGALGGEGYEAFLRFLYETQAPGLVVSSNDQDAEVTVRNWVAGCR